MDSGTGNVQELPMKLPCCRKRLGFTMGRVTSGLQDQRVLLRRSCYRKAGEVKAPECSKPRAHSGSSLGGLAPRATDGSRMPSHATISILTAAGS